MMRHTLWATKDNEVALELRSGGENLAIEQYDAITRVVIRLRPIPAGGGDILMDSSVTPGLLLWGGATGRKVMIEGSKLSDVPVPAGRYLGRVIAYSTDQPDGLVFVDFPDYSLHVRS